MRALRKDLYSLEILNAPSGVNVIVDGLLNLEQLRRVKDFGIPIYVCVNFDENLTFIKPSKQFHYYVQSRGKIIDSGKL